MAKSGANGALVLGGVALLAYALLRRNPDTGQSMLDNITGGGSANGGPADPGFGYDPYSYGEGSGLPYREGGGGSGVDTPGSDGSGFGRGGQAGGGPTPTLVPDVEDFFNANLGTILGTTAIAGVAARPAFKGYQAVASKFRGTAKPPVIQPAAHPSQTRLPTTRPPTASRVTRAASGVGKVAKVLGPVAVVADAGFSAYDLSKQREATRGKAQGVGGQAVGATEVAAGTVANVGGFFTGTKVGYNEKGRATVQQGIPVVSGVLDLFGVSSRARLVG